MKNIKKSALLLLPMMLLAACGNTHLPVETQVVDKMPEVQEAAGEVSTYLVLTKIGLLDGKTGKDNETLFLENAVEYVAAPGSALPGKDKVTSTVKDVEFANWICYEGKGKPTIYDKVPAESGKILYAFFNSKNQGGGGSEVTPPTPPTPVTEGTFVEITGKDGKTNKVKAQANPGNPSETMATGIQVKIGDIIKINTYAKGKTIVNKFKADAISNPNTKKYLEFNKEGTSATVKIACSIDFYISAAGVWPGVPLKFIEHKTLYVIPGKWDDGSHRFAAYFYGAGKEAWANATSVEGSAGTYMVKVPAGNWEAVIFTQMKGDSVNNTWDNKVAQSPDLFPYGAENLYNVDTKEWSLMK